METIENVKSLIDLDQLVKGLQKEDQRNLGFTRNFKILMLVMSPLYILIFIVGNIIDPEPRSSIGLLFYALAFFAFYFIFDDLHKIFKSVDYGLPTIEMLKNAIMRHTFWLNKSYLVLIPAFLICIGFSFSVEKAMPQHAFISPFLIAFVLIFMILLISFFIGYLFWRYRQKPLRDKALQLLNEMEK